LKNRCIFELSINQKQKIMTLQDLRDNRDEIIAEITFTYGKNRLPIIMKAMVDYINNPHIDSTNVFDYITELVDELGVLDKVEKEEGIAARHYLERVEIERSKRLMSVR
jgi:hypothetical protein